MPWSLLGGREPGEELRLGLRPDPGHRAEPSLGRGRAKLVYRPHSQGGCDGDHPFRPDAEQPAEGDELRLDSALELFELRDPARCHEFMQPTRDPRADPLQPGNATIDDELRDRRPRLTDGLGSPPIGACRVEAGARKLE